MKQKIKNALVSVSDKTELNPILKVLKKFKIKIISSGGTYSSIKKLGYDCLKSQNILVLKKCLMDELKHFTLKFMLEYFMIEVIKNIQVK